MSIKRKCHICDIIMLNKLTLTQSKRINVSSRSFSYLIFTNFATLHTPLLPVSLIWIAAYSCGNQWISYDMIIDKLYFDCRLQSWLVMK
jgi:hypothetical protein